VAATKALSSIEPQTQTQQVRTFTRAEYGQMIGLGLFQDERVELKA
jgi:hypothetical protein